MPRHVGLEQLLKHALALNSHGDVRPRHLLYCFWEPVNGAEINEVLEHRAEVGELQARVGDAAPSLHVMTYSGLFDEWSCLARPDWVGAHVDALRERYLLSI